MNIFDQMQLDIDKFFGSPAFKLARKDSPPTSKQAAQSVNTTNLEQLVYETIATFLMAVSKTRCWLSCQTSPTLALQQGLKDC